MANNQFVGKMSFVVGASTSGLNTTMNEAAQSVQNFGNKTTRVQTQVASNAKQMAKFGNKVQQFGFLIDDAFTGFTARGFSGAIQAAANNATMLAMQFGWMAGLVTVLTMGVAQLATKMWKTVDPAKALTNELKRQKVQHDANIEALKTVFELQQQAMEHREFVNAKPDVGAIDDRISQLKKQQREEKHQMQLHGAELANINKEIAQRVQLEMDQGPTWDWKVEEGAQVGKRTFKRNVKRILTDEEKEIRARAKLMEEGNSQNEDFLKALDERDKILAEQQALAGKLELRQKQIDSLLGARGAAWKREHDLDVKEKKEKAAKAQAIADKEMLRQQAEANEQADKTAKAIMDARQMMLDAGRSALLVDDQKGGLELEITANTDKFDAELEASAFKFRRMIAEAEDIPDDAARELQLNAILAQADQQLTDMAKKAGSIKDVQLGSMRSVGASEVGSSQSFSLLNRAVNSNRQDQQNIANEVRAVNGRLAQIRTEINNLNNMVKTVR